MPPGASLSVEFKKSYEEDPQRGSLQFGRRF